jgi:hypothetical protein
MGDMSKGVANTTQLHSSAEHFEKVMFRGIFNVASANEGVVKRAHYHLGNASGL